MKGRGKGTLLATLAGIVALGLLAGRCAPSAPKDAKRAATVSDTAAAAMKVYVAPGDLDEYYLFASGGHSGQVYVYGLPPVRHISTIPVFTCRTTANGSSSTASERVSLYRAKASTMYAPP